MRLCFRVDSNYEIGTGHVRRCLTLADELRDRGGISSFICREFSGNLCDFIASRGYRVQRLPDSKSGNIPPNEDQSGHAFWLGVDWGLDADQTSGLLAKEEGAIDWLVVDHYALDRRWESLMRPWVQKIMVIDDLANRPHDCDLLLDQNLHEKQEYRYNELLPPHCCKLLGPRYALLRHEFLQARRALKARDGKVRRLLIFFGGTDPANATAKALEAVRLLKRPDIFTDVVVGGSNPHREGIKELCTGLSNFAFHCQVENMSELMARADLAIGAGGTSAWERCCLGLPSLVVSLAQNQIGPSSALAERGLHLYLGNDSQVSAETIAAFLHVLLRNRAWLRFLSEASLKVVDGLGVSRVAREMLNQDLTLRPARRSDCDQVFHWRNAQGTRKYSLDPTPISYTDHLAWFEKTLNNPKRILLVGELRGEAIGILRYDLENGSAKVSIYLVPGKYGHGYGPQLLCSGGEWLRTHYPQMRTMRAEVRAENQPSLAAFARAGFAPYLTVFRKELRP